jgi:AcrR family transcriptional regulator
MSIETRKREEKEQRRSEILDAAERVFATGAGDNVTLGEVARIARLSRSLIYFYFEDKEDLYYAVTLRALQHLHHRLGVAARSETRGMDKILALVREYMDFARTRPVYFQAVARLAVRDPSERRQGRYHDKCVNYGERIFRFIAAIIQGGIEDGSIRPGTRHPFALAVALWGCVHGLIQVLAARDRPLYGVATDRLLEEASDLVRNGLASDSA